MDCDCQKKHIFVISGPSGAGKSTLINMLLNEFSGISTVVSHTTRNIRENEVNGQDYHFVSQIEFQKMIKLNQFIEYVECFGNWYGTSLASIMDALRNSNICIMDLEWEGAFNILHNDIGIEGTKTTGILILPPSITALKNRLNGRGSETSETLQRRITESFAVKKIAKYDYIIINNNLNSAYNQLKDAVYGNY